MDVLVVFHGGLHAAECGFSPSLLISLLFSLLKLRLETVVVVAGVINEGTLDGASNVDII